MSNPFARPNPSSRLAELKTTSRSSTLYRRYRTIAAAALLCGSPVISQEISYVLRAPDVACLIENHSEYLAVERDLYFVSLEDCPSTARLAADSYSRNLAATPSFNQRDGAYDKLITLTRAHLACLGTLTPPAGEALYAFAPSECSLRPIGDGDGGAADD